jgi:hypothetical protein
MEQGIDIRLDLRRPWSRWRSRRIFDHMQKAESLARALGGRAPA